MADGEFPWEKIVRPLLDWYAAHARALPWRRDADPYRVWVSEIMLQQTRVETVIPYYERFLRELPDFAALAEVPEDRLLKLWEGLGYYSRARSLQKCAQTVCSRYGGRFPDDYDEVRALPGIGDYTAGAVLSIAFGRPEPAVDGNVARVASRLTGTRAAASDAAFRARTAESLRGVYPAGECGAFTQSLMELGAVVCLPNGRPRCGACPVAAFCAALRCGTQAELPLRKKKKSRPAFDRTVFLLRCGDCVAVRRRAPGGLLGGLWELPNAEGKLNEAEASAWLASLGVRAGELRALPPARHVFTHLEWAMTGFSAECCAPEGEGLRWAPPEELSGTISLPSAFRKYARFFP